MTKANTSAQEMLDQLLNAGKDLAQTGKEMTKTQSAKAKEVAAKGEDYLIDKLGIEDNEVSREALRKGAGVGAAAGALALLLSSRSGRKVATLGGLAGLGALAWKSYKDNGGTLPKTKQEIIGMLKGNKAEVRSENLIRAMVAAAKADDNLADAEITLINNRSGGSADALKIALSQTADPTEIAALADTPQAAREIYAVSCRVADGLNPKERDYLDQLAMALKLDPELAARIETDVRTG